MLILNRINQFFTLVIDEDVTTNSKKKRLQKPSRPNGVSVESNPFDSTESDVTN